MTQLSEHRFTVVAAYDFSEQSGLALARAVALATEKPLVDLHVIGVIERSTTASALHVGHHPDYHEAEALQQRIGEVVARQIPTPPAGHLRLYVHARIGRAAGEILGLAAEVRADEIFVGTHGRSGLSRLLLGSVAEAVVRGASCAVTVVRDNAYVAEPAAAAALAPEPPCPGCVSAREDSQGTQWWCADHGRVRPRPHRYSYTSEIAEIRHGDNVLW